MGARGRGGRGSSREEVSGYRQGADGAAPSPPGRPGSAGAPAKDREIDRAGLVEPDSLPLEAPPLNGARGTAVGAEADATPRVDDAVPGDATPGGERVQGVPDEPRVPGKVREPGDLAIRRDAAARDARDDREDPLAPATRRGQSGL